MQFQPQKITDTTMMRGAFQGRRPPWQMTNRRASFRSVRWKLLSLLCMLALLPLNLTANEAPALYVLGHGQVQIAGEVHSSGASIPLGATLQVVGEAAARLDLVGSEHGFITLAPHSRLRSEELSDGTVSALRLVLLTGTIQVDVDDLPGSGFSQLVVRTPVTEAEMTGTMFVVQRLRRDADYVALMRGSVEVRDTIAALDRAQQRPSQVEILPNQGITIDAEAGMGDVAAFTGSPLDAQTTALFAASAADDDGSARRRDGGDASRALHRRLSDARRVPGAEHRRRIIETLLGGEAMVGTDRTVRDVLGNDDVLREVTLETDLLLREALDQPLAEPPPPPQE
ncbi:MAG: hypothetical protein EA401_13450 [Planctomycetota bacterium]|nr:MAG: hypothetical protein EA401_13450 [Planctomycetota bacterium]